jgi:hypothetical protein
MVVWELKEQKTVVVGGYNTLSTVVQTPSLTIFYLLCSSNPALSCVRAFPLTATLQRRQKKAGRAGRPVFGARGHAGLAPMRQSGGTV